jgi:ComF family protein
MGWKGFEQIKEAFLQFIYPPLCLHCEERLEQRLIFCETCTSLLEIIDPSERCPTCFGTLSSSCQTCLEKKEKVIYRTGAVFDYIGPPATLLKKLKYGQQPYLAEGAAAFLAAQFIRLDWPLPDALVPTPLSFTHWIGRGYNQSELLANHLSSLLQVPVWKALKRRSGDFSQAGLALEQRKQLNTDSFYWNRRFKIEDKTLLLIDDVMTSGSTLQQCGKALLQGYPSHVYALAFCRAIK